MNTQQKDQRGFTMVEMMVSMTVMLVITVAIFSIIVAEQSTHLTQSRKLDMNQGARIIEQMLTEGFRNAGAVLTLAPTPNMIGAPTVPFNGIYPLNNDGSIPSPLNIPDGVILAAGDPLALTRLTATFTPGENTIQVKTVDLPADPDGIIPADPLAWHNNDYGMVMRSDGYYVFRVSSTPNQGDTHLHIRTTAAYYSGQLDTNGYKDNSPSGLGSYPSENDPPTANDPLGSPVVRLEYFNIFLVRLEADNSKTLTLTTDIDGDDIQDVLSNVHSKETMAVPVLPNIEDLQIEYIAKLVPPVVPGQMPEIWAGYSPVNSLLLSHPSPCATILSPACTDFYNLFLTKKIASAHILVLLRTEEEKNKKPGSGITYVKPDMGDVLAPIMPLPIGRYHYTFMRFEVLIRNYNL